MTASMFAASAVRSTAPRLPGFSTDSKIKTRWILSKLDIFKRMFSLLNNCNDPSRAVPISDLFEIRSVAQGSKGFHPLQPSGSLRAEIICGQKNTVLTTYFPSRARDNSFDSFQNEYILLIPLTRFFQCQYIFYFRILMAGNRRMHY